MQTLKTAVVVVLLLVVFYGVYETLNRPPDAPPEDVAALEDMPFDPPEVQFGEMGGDPRSEPATSFPTVSSQGAMESPVPPDTMNAAGSQYAPSFPTAPVPDFAQEQRGTSNEPQLTVEPPSATPPDGFRGGASAGAPPPLASQPLPAAHDPRLQGNPFLNENVLVRPTHPVSQAPSAPIGVRAYERARKSATSLVEEGKYHDALATLSVFYKSLDLTPEEHRELVDLLDPLAGRVIYSREHLVEPAYPVRRNETLAEIAQHYNVPMELLQKINGIDNPDVLVPGTELKVVTGPFRAEVDLVGQELTLFLNGLYAGRFPITIGRDPAPVLGDFKIREKLVDRDYFSIEGRKIEAGNPTNPFGNVWLDLGREVCIHGSPSVGADPQRGCISLSPQDADDVYGILSVGSMVRIVR
ncbi:MAG: L,D-transpeptidase family protein [Pirellulaceae bacterium]